MKKFTLFLFVFCLFSISNSAFANNGKNYAPALENAVSNGVYDVLGRDDLKVKVFVHKEKGFEKNYSPALDIKKNTKGNSPKLFCSPVVDGESDSLVGSLSWKLPASFDYYLNVNSAPLSVGSENISTVVEKSFGVWQNALGDKAPVITNVFTTTKNLPVNDGQNIISWGKTSSQALGVTYVWHNIETGEVVDFDTIMNKNVAWKWSNDATCAFSNAYDVQNTMTHELGHWYGLDDEYESSYVNNTMYGYGNKGEVKKNTLTIGDIAGLLNIYK